MKNDKRITFRLSSDLHNDLVNKSENEKMTLSDMTRLAVEEGLGWMDMPKTQSLSASEALSAKPANTFFGDVSDSDMPVENFDDDDDHDDSAANHWIWAIMGITGLLVISNKKSRS